MRVNFIIPFKRLSGGIKIAYQYAEFLWKNGHDVTVYLPAVSYRGENESIHNQIYASLSNILKREKWFNGSFPIKCVPKINSFFIRKADITIATAWQTAYDVFTLSASKGKKVYLVQGYETFNGAQEHVDKSYCLGLHTITISKYLHDLLLNQFNVDSEIIYDGIEEKEFADIDFKKGKHNSVMLMYHESDYKGTKEGLEIVEKLRLSIPELKLNIFGRRLGNEVPTYADSVENPTREQLIQMYRASDVFLATSRIESWGLPVLEAMANKCAVIGFPVGALEEIATDKNVVLCNKYDYDIMREKAMWLLNDAEELHNIQEEGFATACNFTAQKSCEQFEHYLRKLLD